ncbi:TIGR04283 family arsenosugar biosynthesis glycosyltransferase [Desulfatitalea alkaliphila]|uniref:TIGR04283 family arsenosugar biosynthesis glycosyltransferase n=1 Tax=Desulfatitalea alkaliphila TaxID=2929485 RepID=A0AA41R3L5_9BACT|nr:TIGR04283 family arsenosugar biosynthesis glycosyltransferase [Desulfatitalea alkaliphila]MCJ8500380.1 TIGR04283 family arsenosugar biosynthesis glycosyltransferase [Desulfatitalea alkaliphila]
MPGVDAQRRLILFGRYPVPGRTNTRLIPVVGPLGAAELQRQWTERAVAVLKGSRLAPVAFVYADGTAQQVRRWLGREGIELIPQVQGDLGQRMAAALADGLHRGASQVVLLGTDVPRMTARHLEMAFEALAGHDLVLGPARDGGYWLVGCRKAADVFTGIPWGTPEVLAQTMARAQAHGLSLALLPPMDDIDTPADLAALHGGRQGYAPFLSVVIPTLNEAVRIGPAVAEVMAPDIEVIVADGGSRDDTVFKAKAAGATVITAEPGRAVQQNAGAHLAKGSALLFLHADTRLPGDFGARVFECLLDPAVVLGAFHFQTDWDHWAMHAIARLTNARSRRLKLPYGDQGFFLRKRVFDRVGGFPMVPIAEDLLLARRLAPSGRIALAPGAAVTSSRRWRRRGIVRTTLINAVIAGGLLLGISPDRLAGLYHR